METTLRSMGQTPGGSKDLGGVGTNVGDAERAACLIGGAALTGFGLGCGRLGGLALSLVGGALVYRGWTGHCDLYESLGVNTAERGRGPATSVAARTGVKVEETFVVNRPAGELYRFWRDLENLPRFMRHVKSVTVSGRRSHWVAQAPAGATVEWDAEIINEREGRMIAWRSLPGADVDNAGSVHFMPVGGGTRVEVTLKYLPPMGKVGAAVAKLFGEDAQRQVREDVCRFKQVMESGAGRQAVGAGGAAGAGG